MFDTFGLYLIFCGIVCTLWVAKIQLVEYLRVRRIRKYYRENCH